MTSRRRQSGLTLVEVLVAVSLIAIVIVPALLALRTSVVGSAVNSDVTNVQYRLTSGLERVLAEPFATLETAALGAGGPSNPSELSEPTGVPGRLLVFVAFYDGDDADGDGDGFTGADADLLWIRIESEGTVHALETIRARGL